MFALEWTFCELVELVSHAGGCVGGFWGFLIFGKFFLVYFEILVKLKAQV